MKRVVTRRCQLHVSKCTKSASAEKKELEEGIHKLQSIHADNYDYGQYRLWARMIKNNQWKDFNNPPNLPMITGKVSRKDKGANTVTVVDTLATAAVAIIKELKKDTTILQLREECALQVECPQVRRLSFALNT